MDLSQFDIEKIEAHHQYILGSDEVGRGPLAGPVVAASVAVSRDQLQEFSTFASTLGITDSKKLTDKKRLMIMNELGIDLDQLQVSKKYHHQFFEYSLAELTHEEIDKYNILWASMMAMDKSRESLKLSGKVLWLVDGNRAPIEPMDNLDISCVVKGDQKSLCIALSSIIAKTYRDHLMSVLAKKYPGYGLDKHAGYPTATHREAIKNLGPSPIHRLSFKGVKEYVEAKKGI